jgi:hypothetical protein
LLLPAASRKFASLQRVHIPIRAAVPAEASAAARRFIGSDKGAGDVARHTKRLLRERFRPK